MVASTVSMCAMASVPNCSPSVEIAMSRILRDAKNYLAYVDYDAGKPKKRVFAPRGEGLDDQMICLQRQRSKRADQALIVLLDYYIGEGEKGMLMLRIAERGKPMIPLLNAKKGAPVTCPFKPKDMCDTSDQHRLSRDIAIESILRNIPKRRGEPWRD